MPTPGKDEKQSAFVSRCIGHLIGKENKFPNTKEGRKKAAGRCHGIWRQHKGGKKPEESATEYKEAEASEEDS